MERDIERVLISRERIAERVRQLAGQITADHSAAEDGQIAIIPILTGAMIFCADLIRHMPLRMRIALIAVSSYPGASVRSQGASLLSRRLGDLRGRRVLVVDDILDSGQTLAKVVPIVQGLGPVSVKTCVLLRKDRLAARRVAINYVGFDIPDEFVVGYGLDYDDYYRNLPDIVTLKPAVLAKVKKP